MGFSLSAVAAIFLASSVLLFSTLYEAVNESYDDIDDARDMEEDRRNDKIASLISVHALTYDRVTSTLNISADNDGSTVLSPQDTDVLVGGVLETDSIALTRVNGASTDVWAPEDRALFSLSSINSVSYDTSVGSRFLRSVTDNLASAGDIYSADRIYVIDGTAVDVFDLDYDHDSTMTSAQLTAPGSVSASSSHIYVRDSNDHVDVFTLGATYDSTINLAQMSNNLYGIDVGNSRLLVADGTNGLVLVNLPGGTYDTTITTNLSSPRDVACGDTHYYVLDNNDHVDAFSISTGAFDYTISTAFNNSGELAAPTRIAYLNDHLYILDEDAGTKHVDIFNDDGTHVDTITDDVGSAAAALDAGNRLLLSRGASGINVLNLGTKVKIATENGVSAYATL